MLDIPDCIEAYMVIYDDGEIAGVYECKRHAERAHAGEEYQMVRLVPADAVIIKKTELPGR